MPEGRVGDTDTTYTPGDVLDLTNLAHLIETSPLTRYLALRNNFPF